MWFENNVCLLRTIVDKYLLKTNKLRTPKMWFITFHSVDNLIEVQNHKNFQLCWTFVVELAWLAKNQPSTKFACKVQIILHQSLKYQFTTSRRKMEQILTCLWKLFISFGKYVWVLKTKNRLHMVCYLSILNQRPMQQNPHEFKYLTWDIWLKPFLYQS